MRDEEIESCYENFCIEKRSHCRNRYTRCCEETSVVLEMTILDFS